MIYSFHPEAEKELNEALLNTTINSKNGLGFEFTEEVYLAIQEIISFPQAWTNMSANTRRCLLKRFFPYGIIYNIDKA